MIFRLCPFVLLGLCAGAVYGQNPMTRHTVEFGASGLFPVGGYKADEYSAGPGLRVGYELRLARHFGAEIGWSAGWLPGTSCSRSGCAHPREELKLLDYGLRAVLPLAADRVEFSVGIGGGYIWLPRELGDDYYNDSLLQYSGKVTLTLDSRKRFRAGFTVRAWRDVGRPIQQWLSTSVGISYGFGGRF